MTLNLNMWLDWTYLFLVQGGAPCKNAYMWFVQSNIFPHSLYVDTQSSCGPGPYAAQGPDHRLQRRPSPLTWWYGDLCDVLLPSKSHLMLLDSFWIICPVFRWKPEILLNGSPKAPGWPPEGQGHCAGLPPGRFSPPRYNGRIATDTERDAHLWEGALAPYIYSLLHTYSRLYKPDGFLC